MLKLDHIVKHYAVGSMTVQALRGIDLEFRRSEFVAVLGPSGCGKTTLLNIIGGLDRYTEGDLSINGKSTKDFGDREWDIYRNHSVGFVFQSYNLIPHQTVLANVELALTLTGISRAERRKRAVDVLTQVGLADQIHKKPNQLSGGQAQRVAIARALINDPDILLADEPTGALDTETSEQVMNILKQVATDRLVIMVTHNPGLAEKYATRIIRLLDGMVISDSDPYDSTGETLSLANEGVPTRKPSMSFPTALSLSTTNLMTKKTRTLLTAFAGSIGIIGIALILSLSSGFQAYIKDVERDTLASYPITLERETVDLARMMRVMDEVHRRGEMSEDQNAIHVSTRMTDMMNLSAAQQRKNDLSAFKAYIEEKRGDLSDIVTAVSYSYEVNMTVFGGDYTNEPIQVHPTPLYDILGMNTMMEWNPNASLMRRMSGLEVWQELLDNPEFLASQYEVVAGTWPEAFDEVVLIVNERNEISDVALYGLGLANPNELPRILTAVRQGQEVAAPTQRYIFADLLDLRFKVVLPTDFFVYDGALGVWLDKRGDESHLRAVIDQAVELKVVGIIRPSSTTLERSVSGSIGYLPSLTEYVVNATSQSEIVQQQLANPDINVFTGMPFGRLQAMEAGNRSGASFALPGLTPEQLTYLAGLPHEELAALAAQFGAPTASIPPVLRAPADTYDEVMALLGTVDLEHPTRINMYAADFASREAVAAFIADYNRMRTDAGEAEYVIHYTDLIEMMMSSVTSIINSISYVLIAFVAIALVVSSIMIGIITYISVLERTKEIGVLRSLGASKRDIARVFNAETLIVGFVSGALGIALTVLLCIPINMLIEAVSEIPGVAALPVGSAVVLIAISMGLTLIAGLIPSRIAAQKDPVVALRTE